MRTTSRITAMQCIALAAAALCGQRAAGDTLHVPGDYVTIKVAIHAAADGDIIEIADGTYTGAGNTDLDFTGKAITVRSASGDPALCTLDCEGDGTGVRFTNGEGPDSVLTGLAIVNAGVSVRCEGSGPTIENCDLRNARIASVLCIESSAAFTDCQIVNDLPELTATGVRCLVSSELALTRCTIAGHQAGTDGGGILCTLGSSVSLADCTIKGNSAPAHHGGGIACLHGSTLIATNCVIDGNVAGEDGGGVYCDSNGALVLDRCRISQNTAGSRGGGICCLDGSTLVASRSLVLRNRTLGIPFYGSGGGLHLGTAVAATLTMCEIADNDAEFRGGGVYSKGHACSMTSCVVRGNFANGDGGGIYASTAELTLANCTMVDNVIHDVSYGRAKTGGGVRSVEDVAMTNCIVWGNIPDSLDVTGTVTYSVVAGGWPGEGNIDEDPQLTHDGHLTGTSPCIDRGDPAGEYPDQSDLDGEPRVLKGRVDMGADEWVDSDEDHLPDWWESHYFGDAAAAHADADEEADGRINIREYELASEPFIGPRAYYVAVTGNDAWDGRCAEWDGGTCGPKATIQAAIDACHATEGDEVRLADGTYTGTGNRALRFGGRAMTLRSASGNRSACVIDCEHQDQALLFLKGEDAASIVADITIANGHAVEAGFTDGQGGGLYCYYSGPQLRNCRITGCSAGLFGGGIACSSGGIVLRDCLIDQNEAEYDGGGLWCVVGGLVFLEGCALVDNTGYGFGTHGSCGGLYAEDCDVWLRHCTVHGNTGNSQGGIQLLYCNANMADCLITNNVGLTGVGIALVQCTMTASGLTIADNVAEWQYGGALLVSHSDTSVSHCVMWGNGADPVAYYPTMQSMTFCATEFGAGESWFGEGCIDTDPLFVDPDGPDDDPATWEDNDYRLQVESPCLDAGNPGFVLEPGAADLDGRLRVWDGDGDAIARVDMGAYEYGSYAYGDLNCDGSVDGFDISAFVLVLTRPNEYETTYPDCAATLADLDADGAINGFDIDPFVALLAVD